MREARKNAIPRMRALIVDDQAVARQGVRRLLEKQPDVDVVGECGTGREAVATIAATTPDVVFMDVQMPDMTGFEVLHGLDAEAAPAVIFMTACEAYALQAFEVHALDYLLEPYDDARFLAALERAREGFRRRHESALGRRVQALLRTYGPDAASNGDGPATPGRYLQRLAVKTGGRVQFFKVDEVDWIEAAGDYVCLHVDDHGHYVREKMSTLADRLDPDRFARIHRSYIVNLDRVRELRGHDHGGYVVQLDDGTHLKLSRGYQEEVMGRLGNVG